MTAGRGQAAHRSSLYLLVGAASSAVLGYGLWFLLARTLAPEVVGASGAAVSLLAVVSLLSAAGLAPTVLAGVGADRVRGGAIAGTATAVAVAGGVGIGGVTLVGAVAIGAVDIGIAGALAFTVAAGAGAGMAVLDATAIGAGHSGIVLARTLALGVSRLALAWVVARGGGGVDAVLGVWAVSLSVALAVSYLGIRQRDVPVGFGRLRGSGIVGRAGWNQVVTVTAQAPGFLLPVIVAAAVSAAANAGYYLAWQIAGGCFMVAASTTPTLLARAAGRDVAVVEHTAASVTRLTMGLLVPAVLAVVLVGPMVLGLLGDGYQDARWVLWVFAVAAFPDAYTSLAVARLRATGRERRAAGLNGTMGLITVGGSLLLVPAVGSIGAAIAFAVAQSAGSCYWLLSRRRNAHPARGAAFVATTH